MLFFAIRLLEEILSDILKKKKSIKYLLEPSKVTKGFQFKWIKEESNA